MLYENFLSHPFISRHSDRFLLAIAMGITLTGSSRAEVEKVNLPAHGVVVEL